ncbi:uncharacterized protein LOC125672707 isoform X2 [Ostrea edulis]|uniref:uncharacterized protein LOC125672707 isoform X2 n=1 Tax=Ostrea edulis TaxID=37623 RepID=UPI0024AF9CFE|nr:uncharacterized protein LOC125672707 isoform X2 [Ostrea edulis]
MRAASFLVIFMFLKNVDTQKSKVHLEKISTLYIPSRYDSNDFPEFKLGKHAAEQLAYDPTQKILYVTGEEKLTVVDISDPSNPLILYRKKFEKMDPTDVEYCGNHVFLTVNNDVKPEEGRVMVFRKYNKRHNTMPVVLNLVVGPSPNMLLPTFNCQTVLVALEGEPFARGGNLIDPEGAIGIIKFPNSYISKKTYSYKTLDFKHFNNKYPALSKSGVRFVYKGNGNTLAQDLEPEHITLSADEKKAFVTLQENNAIAEVDLVREKITNLRGLGFKDWKKYKLDPSDSDGGINIYPYPVYGIYQPDAIRTVKVRGREYIVTADEGNSKDYSRMKLTIPGFNEVERVRDITLSKQSEVLKWAKERKIPNIQHEALLGKLLVTTENGRRRDGTYDKLYTFGGRGFSVLTSDTMLRVYDSGSNVEESHAKQYPKLFNSLVKSSANITDTVDSRSDSKGPESESLAVAYDGRRVIVFLGNERPGSISIYSFNNDMSRGSLESIYSGARALTGTWGSAFSRGYITDMDPDDIKYLSPNQSPNGRPMLLVAGSDTGTISLFNVRGMRSPLKESTTKALVTTQSKVTIPWKGNQNLIGKQSNNFKKNQKGNFYRNTKGNKKVIKKTATTKGRNKQRNKARQKTNAKTARKLSKAVNKKRLSQSAKGKRPPKRANRNRITKTAKRLLKSKGTKAKQRRVSKTKRGRASKTKGRRTSKTKRTRASKTKGKQKSKRRQSSSKKSKSKRV